MKYPLTYVQGPQGTGKTNTIINTICSQSREEEPLLYLDVKNQIEQLKNTAPAEVEVIIDYACHHQDKKLGVKPFSSTVVEEDFLQNLTHALENIWLSESKYAIHKEVAISQVFRDNITHSDLFYNGRFDFVVYEK